MRRALVLWLCLSARAFAAPGREVPRVALLSTGGTIDMSGALARSADRPALWVGQKAVPALAKPLDSSQIGPAEWKQIIRAVDSHAAAPGIAAVLKHGTDTLEQTGLVLSLVFDGRLKKPVVLTGAWAPPDQPGSDAARNLERAHALAASPHAPPLVYAVIGDEIHLASRVKKTRTEPMGGRAYFESAGGAVGRFGPDGNPVFSAKFLREAPLWRGLGMEPSEVRFARVAMEWAKGKLVLAARALKAKASDVPDGLDPVRAALKLSMILASPRHAADALAQLRADMAGEVQPGRQALFAVPPPEDWPRGVQVVVASQDLPPARVAAAARKLVPALGPSPKGASMLETISWAVRGGVDVVIATNAYKSPSDLRAYEIGEKLAAAGARDSGGKTFAELLRETPPKPRLILIGTGSGHLKL